MSALNWLVLFSPEQRFYDEVRKRYIKFRINFITLTLSSAQEQNDDYIKTRLLQPFIKWLLRQGATAYIWKAETQNNGNIHFHITTNIYIHWSKIKTKWNELQDAHGFLNAYTENYGDNNPNSTDVHSVHKHADLINSIGDYFGKIDEWCRVKGTKAQKELTQHPSQWLEACQANNKPFPVPKRQVAGRKWAVSNNLTNIKVSIDEEELGWNVFNETLDFFLDKTPHRYLKKDFADIYIYDEQKLFTDLHPLIVDRIGLAYHEFYTNAPKP